MVQRSSLCIVCDFLMNCGALVPPMNAHVDSVGCLLVLGNAPLLGAFASLHNEFVFFIQQESVSELYIEVLIFIMIALLRVSTSKSMIPRPCFRILNRRLFIVLLHVCLLPSLLQIVTTNHNHPYHLYFTISSSN